jgi:hypothetical protein
MMSRIAFIPILLALHACLLQPALAQTRADSTSIARLIVSRALQDAQRQSADIRFLSYNPKSNVRDPHDRITNDAPRLRVLELAVDSQLVQRVDSPIICPWHEGGRPNPALQIVVGQLAISTSIASAQVMLSCAPGRYERRGRWFGWGFTYTFARGRDGWSISEVREDWIT